ncbi:RNA polymerase sigma factor [Aureispira anguillae]|uniref:RNA polymerase sigma factor n=1 Tax=Aureispira anguillae TaxID=2864201 RepID=A0A915YBY4_9BACT|nr:RNA polymerase sigma factor [Aureispira anguillae]BDS10268.1 RNA polymerase sigma factor [Aureispira anguillae]
MSSNFYTLYIDPYSAIIIKICRTYTNTQEDFEDYYQEVCLQIWRSRANFKQQSEWSTWIYRISLNVCLTLFKKDKKNKTSVATLPIPTEIDEEPTYSDEALNQLNRAIKQLSEIDRAVILLYLEGKAYKEIAEILSTNTNNIGVRIQRIKKRLKKILTNER